MNSTDKENQRSPDLVDRMPLYARRVVDVGCGTGENARIYRQRANPESYVGLEIVSEDAETAKEHCTECYVGDIEKFDELHWRALKDFDLWVFGDVLEHLYDPWTTLRKVKQQIPINGEIICCIPNAQHWSVQLKLANGDWRYEGKGLLDRTHIRFFTRQTILEMLAQSGFEVFEITPRYIHHPLQDKYLNLIGETVEISGGDASMAKSDAAVFQYIVRAR